MRLTPQILLETNQQKQHLLTIHPYIFRLVTSPLLYQSGGSSPTEHSKEQKFSFHPLINIQPQTQVLNFPFVDSVI